jgi:hypothetical protein
MRAHRPSTHHAVDRDDPASQSRSTPMPRIVIERTLLGGTWVHSWGNEREREDYGIYDGRTPEAIRQVVGSTGVPSGHAAKVSVLAQRFLV